MTGLNAAMQGGEGEAPCLVRMAAMALRRAAAAIAAEDWRRATGWTRLHNELRKTRRPPRRESPRPRVTQAAEAAHPPAPPPPRPDSPDPAESATGAHSAHSAHSSHGALPKPKFGGRDPARHSKRAAHRRRKLAFLTPQAP